MKNFIKGRWFPLLLAILMVAVAAFVMALFGWRVTYAPELETSWACVSAIASLIGAVGTVAAVWFAVLSSDKQNKLSNKQQKQNTGLNLYAERRTALRLFAEKKYDEMFWDATILFSAEIVDKIHTLSCYESTHKEYCNLIDEYVSAMENCVPDLYQQYIQLTCEDNDDTSDDIMCLCSQFKPIVNIPWSGEKQLLDYRELKKKELRAKQKSSTLHSQVFELMRKEIEDSIQ